MTTGDVVYSLRFSLIKILPEPGFDLGSTAGESCVLTARLHMLYLVHNCRNEEIYITKSDFFYNFFFICNPKLCINQEIKVNEGDFLIFFLVILCQSHLK